MATKCGIRVVRGPTWSGSNEDGGEGHLGTMVAIPAPGRVSVIWDMTGEERVYSAGRDDKFELRIYDNGPVGVKFTSVTCDACKTEGIGGMRWKCAVCTDYDLCTPCYYGDRHDRTHPFFRFTTQESKLVRLPPRSASIKQDAYGLVKGAQVVRGPHWHFENQDGGQGSRGEITELGTYSGGCYRGGVRVRWPQNPDKLSGYRIGADGKVELKAVSKTKGGNFYPDHLPALDVIKPDQIHLKQGDKVIVDVDISTFKKLQKEHRCGWNDSMKQCLTEVGTIVRIPHPSLMQVQYEDARIWNVLRHVLNKVGSFQKGGSVRIIDIYNAAVELQVGHGGWNDRMEDALGKIGKILDVDGDGDLKVEVDGKQWLLNPVSCTQYFDANQQQTVKSASKEPTPPVSRASSIGERISSFYERLPSDISKDFMLAASEGDIGKVKAFVANNKSKVDLRVDGRTALHVACHKGHLQIVQVLLDGGADINMKDEDGDTPLHYAADGEKILVLEELCKRKAKLDVQNRNGLTGLHIAVIGKDLASVDVLVNNGADINVQDLDGDTPLHEAIRKNYFKIVNSLLKSEALDGSKTNKDNQNVMHVAVIAGNQRVVEEVIKKSRSLASVTCGRDDFTPLHLAAINGQTAVAGILLKQGQVAINAKDKHNRTPLHHAVHCCRQQVIDVLLCSGADPNVQDEDGNTPAHLAQMPKLSTAVDGEDDVLVQSILCMLAECGADLFLKNEAGKTPLDLCKTPELVTKLKGIAEKVRTRQGVRDDLPPYWSSMNDKELLIELLRPDNALTAEEYRDVKQKFHRTMANAEVVSIKRIQNRALWDVYFAAKRTMERKYGLGAANELTLFHGTSFKSVEAIQHQNIDPLLAGENVGAIWGKGAYFATDAKASDSYASSDDEGYRYMFMVRVLAGRISQGSRDFKRPPPLDASRPNELADAVVDDINNPRIYVIFRNQQIYPEFLIQYL